MQEIIIDGFKSYAHRTVVPDFDPLFNAITGLNGSGKSNILDAICFVLGISNLSQVRAGNLQDLVYKQGQAGVNRASVTIVFDNSDKAQSPVGYEAHDEITICRQIIIGGRNKYFINGHNAQPQRVQNLFHSVQLNVNNPHFLIMQGRITKVLNMKPPEILSMIEEAAGTRMYETKKQAAYKTMAKKDKKFEHINQLLDEEITPTLDKLRQDRSAYLEYTKTRTEVEHLSRFVVACDYQAAEQRLQSSSQQLEELDARIKALEADKRRKEMERDNEKQNLELKQRQRASEQHDDLLQRLEAEVADLSKKLVKAKAELDTHLQGQEEERRALADIHKAIDEAQAALASKRSENASAGSSYEDMKATFEQADERVRVAQRGVEAVKMGMTMVNGESKSFAEEMRVANETATEAQSAQQKATNAIKHLEAELKDKRPKAKASEKEYAKNHKMVAQLQEQVAAIEAQLQEVQADPAQLDQLRSKQSHLETRRQQLKDQVADLSAKLAAVSFDYRDPYPNFDRSKVKGLVAELVQVKDHQTSTALEVAAGSKLYQVVVDDEVTAKELLSKGQLQRRVTIIPLNKISQRTVKPDVVAEAKKQVGDANVDLALSLVGYPAEVDAAMKNIFGSTLVCSSIDAAEKVTFNKRVMTRSVTLEGDSFDPSGVLSGGAKSSSAGLLNKLQKLAQLKQELSATEAELEAIKREIKEVNKALALCQDLTAQRDGKASELEVLLVRLDSNVHYKAVSEVQALEEQLIQAGEQQKEAKAAEAAAKARVKALQKEESEFASQRDAKLKAADKELKAARKARDSLQADMDRAQSAHDEGVLEVESLEAELASLQQQVKAQEETIAAMGPVQETLTAEVERRQEAFRKRDADLMHRKERLMEIDSEITSLKALVRELSEAIDEATIEAKKSKHTQQTLQTEKATSLNTVRRLLQENAWIESEQAHFGKPGTAFEIKKGDASRDPALCRDRLRALLANQTKLEKTVNMKVLSMFEKAEAKYNDLLKKKAIVEQDKEKIEAVIKELDEKKNEALLKAYAQVNRDFGSIFSTLLPGTKAKLEPVEGTSVLDGLEVKIAFGDVWKESLTELSGGQRSLVALSLILSLLLFKPAPLYILDEVDAALDLSHTQNIGQMLRTHFNKSQFIVVSLKDGMFNNANVLFKTKFVDGVSTVRRYAQGPASLQEPVDKENSSQGARARGKKAARTQGRSAGLTASN
ncbi:uncharacterized protein MONBRDRAFT_18617 [Monosiga brevicollis MX1]|uniref:Structural maintenance of chromosomes protein n=1 Tax=Monosiga brevicollis TaxID=81824 RepID=A9UWJ6_MONBE|nr:uncharacterized protein MONBRDRAFT_18617 [Monosiga brevicollis MX1]EDQ90224.1 predicted protein [Monosiga brevicollis MX1]|eukprot:XP_001744991.1 hypothetical protein [Monosiga brevicollis MX1]